jgi:protein AbiQ
MIPVPLPLLIGIDLSISPEDSKDDINYKKLLWNQRSWCNTHESEIIKRAKKLHNLVLSGKSFSDVINRCCDFKGNEKRYFAYCEKNGINT